jgi:hypothetical protein
MKTGRGENEKLGFSEWGWSFYSTQRYLCAILGLWAEIKFKLGQNI